MNGLFLASSSGSSLFGDGLILLAIALYFLPALLAFNGVRPNRVSVLVVDLFLGWTVIGWIIALAMAVGGAPTTRTAPPAAAPTLSPDGRFYWDVHSQSWQPVPGQK